MLGNHFYIGEVKYKNEILPGEQPPIMDRALFDAVRQKSLAQWSHRTVVRNKSDQLLTGLLFDDAGHRMVPTHGADSLRRSASIRNNCGTGPKTKVPNYGSTNIRITGAVRSNFALKTRSPGTEFLDAETRRQKSQPKSVNAGRDQNPGM